MKLINKSKGTVLADNVSVADTLFARMIGLLGRADLTAGRALIITRCNSVHTFFMRFAIDVLFVDREQRIVKAISHLKPFCLSGIYFSSAFVIELPAGTLVNTSTLTGDTITLE
jgi:hypothetical protein